MAFFPGLGNGTFGPEVVSLAASAPRSLALGDLDRDGLTDAAVANTNANNVTIHYGVAGAAGPFAATANLTLTTAPSPVSVVIADINKDGLPDLTIAALEANAASSYIDVRLGQCM